MVDAAERAAADDVPKHLGALISGSEADQVCDARGSEFQNNDPSLWGSRGLRGALEPAEAVLSGVLHVFIALQVEASKSLRALCDKRGQFVHQAVADSNGVPVLLIMLDAKDATVHRNCIHVLCTIGQSASVRCGAWLLFCAVACKATREVRSIHACFFAGRPLWTRKAACVKCVRYLAICNRYRLRQVARYSIP